MIKRIYLYTFIMLSCLFPGLVQAQITIEAEDFVNTGGTFDDASAGGPGLGAGKTDVGINYVNRGDWMDYIIEIPESGDYLIEYFTGTTVDGSGVEFSVDSATQRKDEVPNNGDFDEYQAFTSGGPVFLAAGARVIRLTGVDQDWCWNLDNFVLTKTVSFDIPTLTIQAEDFVSTGGTFDDASAGGPGLGAGKTDVGINYVNRGDWMDYEVEIPISGDYSIEYFTGTTVDGSGIEILVDSVSQRKDEVPNNGNFDDYQPFTSGKSIFLAAGKRIIRIMGADKDWCWNLDNFVLTRIVNTDGIELLIEAEDFTETGGTFDDASAGGPGLGVGKTDVGINFVNAGDWVEFTVEIPASGDYSIEYFTGTTVDGSGVDFMVDGITTRNDEVPNNGNFDVYQPFNSAGRVFIKAGTRIIRLMATDKQWAWNLDNFILSKEADAPPLSVENFVSQPSIKVYPNPTQDYINFDGISIGEYNISIVSIASGHQVLERKVNIHKDFTLNLSHLEAGIYQIILQRANSVIQKRIVINR